MTSTTNTANAADSAEICENCSSTFSLFKRKKACSYCKQAFCQFCVSRPKQTNAPSQHFSFSNISNGTAGSSTERICSLCQSIVEPQTTTDDLMKLKLKHLRSFLNAFDISTDTCKDKRDLAELVIKSRAKAQRPPHANQQQQQQQQSETTGFSTGQTASSPNTASPTFNDRFTGFMNNVQDFVNFNLSSVLNNPPVPCPPPPTSTSTTNNCHPPPPTNGPSQTQGNTSQTYSSQQPNANTTHTFSSSSNSIPNNLNSVFSFIGEQLPNVINNNIFTFNANNFSTTSMNSSLFLSFT